MLTPGGCEFGRVTAGICLVRRGVGDSAMSEGVGSGIPGDETQDGAGAEGGRTEQDDAQQAEVEQDEAEQDDGAQQQSGDVEEQAGDVEPSESEPGDAAVVPVV